MMISTKGRYALRFLVDIAEHQAEGYVPLKDVAERQGISYVSASLDEVVRQTAGEEAADMADDVVLGCGDEDLVDDVREVLEARLPLYREAAHHELDARQSITELCLAVRTLLRH